MYVGLLEYVLKILRSCDRVS